MKKDLQNTNFQKVHFPESNQEAIIFGFQLPYIPDFLADHTLLGQSYTEKLSEVLGRFERFIIGLRKYRSTAYCLRYIAQPERGTIQVFLLGRVLTPSGQAEQFASQVASDLSIHLTSFGLPHQSLSKDQGSGAVSISYACQPFPNSPALVEVRMHETLVPLMTVNKEAFVIHPYWGPEGALLEPFETLLRQAAPVALSIYLEPVLSIYKPCMVK